jgi:hypothetical protein
MVGTAVYFMLPRMRAFFSPPVKTKSIPYPAVDPVSLALKDGQYVSFDRSSGQLVRLNSNGGRIIDRQAFPNPDAAALGIAKSCLWSVDPVSRKIYRHHPDSCVIVESFKSPGPEPSAVYNDGESLWTADRATRKVYRHAIADGLPVVQSSPILEEDPIDLLRVEDRLWVLDGAAGRISRYRIAASLEPEGGVSLRDYLPAGSVPVGFAAEGRWLWVMTRSPSSMHRISLRSLDFSGQAR